MFPHRRTLAATTFALVAILFCVDAKALKRKPDAGFKTSPSITFEVTRTLAHDPRAFTEGLELCDGTMIESVGLYGASALIRRPIESVEVLASHLLPDKYFGEGVTCFGDRIYQLTWREQTAVAYNNALQPQEVLHYSGEGWGLTHDAEHLIMSNGSAQIVFRDARDFSIVRTLDVHDGDTPVDRLNELEYVNGLIFANVWQRDRIAVIDAHDGAVRGWLQLGGLADRFAKPANWNASDDVLNGIAYDAKRDRYYVTGKRWPLIFELKLDGLPSSAATPTVPRR